MSVGVDLRQSSFDVRDVKPSFDLPKVGPRWSYDLTADGRRILAVTRKGDVGSTPRTLIVNWPALVMR